MNTDGVAHFTGQSLGITEVCTTRAGAACPTWMTLRPNSRIAGTSLNHAVSRSGRFGRGWDRTSDLPRVKRELFERDARGRRAGCQTAFDLLHERARSRCLRGQAIARDGSRAGSAAAHKSSRLIAGSSTLVIRQLSPTLAVGESLQTCTDQRPDPDYEAASRLSGSTCGRSPVSNAAATLASIASRTAW
jgi:hypothetical protein